MRIRLAILERDTSYLSRLVAAFSTKYADKFEMYSFTDPGVALSSLDQSKIDVLCASDVFDIDVSALPRRCGFAYLVDSHDVETVNGQSAICKFQKADLIYKQILSVYSDTAGKVSGLKLGGDSTSVILFESPAGGTGASTMAAACAMHYAAQGRKVLFLDLDKFGSADLFFNAEGQFDMTDIIYAVKSKKANLALKLESCVKQDPSGVFFFSGSKFALDMLEFGLEETVRLLDELKLNGGYDYIVLCADFAKDRTAMKLRSQAHAVVWISDGSSVSNSKFIRAYNALVTLDQSADSPVASRVLLLYNKFSSQIGQHIGDIGVRELGGAPKYEHATTAQILAKLAPMPEFDKIV